MITTYEKKESLFWPKVKKSKGCWEWLATRSTSGYGLFRIGKVMIATHRVAWILKNKRLPANWVLHKCDNRLCVRPSHLYEGTRQDNIRDAVERKRMFNAKKTRCPLGHVYDESNTRVYNKRRHCRKCDWLRKRDLR